MKKFFLIISSLVAVFTFVLIMTNTTAVANNSYPERTIVPAGIVPTLVLTSETNIAEMSTAGEEILSPQNSSFNEAIVLSAVMKDDETTLKPVMERDLNRQQCNNTMMMTWSQTATTSALVQWRKNSESNEVNTWNLTALPMKEKTQWRNSDVATMNLTDKTRTMMVQWRSVSSFVNNNNTFTALVTTYGTKCSQSSKIMRGSAFSMMKKPFNGSLISGYTFDLSPGCPPSGERPLSNNSIFANVQVNSNQAS